MAGDANNISIGSAQVCVNNSDIGFTTGGVKISYQPTFVEVRADQVGGIVKRYKQEERLFVEFELIEITIERLREIFGYPTSNLWDSNTALYLGYLSGCSLEEVPLRIISPGLGCCTREWNFTKAISVSEAELNFQRDQESRISAKFEILKQSNGQFGWVRERSDCAISPAC